MIPESIQYIIITYLDLKTEHLLVSQYWLNSIKHYTQYLFDTTKFHKHAEKNKQNINIKSYFHYIHVKNKICCICKKHFAGKFNKFWKIFAHEHCIRNSIINIYYLTECEKHYIHCNEQNLLLEIKNGYRQFIREKYQYKCIWKNKFTLIPYNQTLQYIKSIPHIFMQNHKDVIKTCVKEIKQRMKGRKKRIRDKQNYDNKLKFLHKLHIEMYETYTEVEICKFLHKENINIYTIQTKNMKKKTYKVELMKKIAEFTKKNI